MDEDHLGCFVQHSLKRHTTMAINGKLESVAYIVIVPLLSLQR